MQSFNPKPTGNNIYKYNIIQHIQKYVKINNQVTQG